MTQKSVKLKVSIFKHSQYTGEVWCHVTMVTKCLDLIVRFFPDANHTQERKQGFSDQFSLLGNCPPTPPLSQHYHLLLTEGKIVA